MPFVTNHSRIGRDSALRHTLLGVDTRGPRAASLGASVREKYSSCDLKRDSALIPTTVLT
jgi:hypothetical protein